MQNFCRFSDAHSCYKCLNPISETLKKKDTKRKPEIISFIDQFFVAMQNHDTNIETCNQLSVNMNKFPQPTTPINSYDLEIQQFPSESEPTNVNSMNISEPSLSAESLQTASGEEEKEEEEKSVEELLKLISELNEKLPSSVTSEVNLGHQINKLKGLKGYSSSTRTRGFNGPLERIKCKLERFKIRTVQQEGGVVVVQDDDKDKQ